METAVAEFFTTLKIETWIAFAAFGMYLAYKISIAGMITYGAVKVLNKLLEVLSCGFKE
jgi:hypothetical protein